MQNTSGFLHSAAEAFTNVLGLLHNQPEISLFIAIALGFWIGKRKFGPIQLGGVCGTLLVALLLGQSEVQIDPSVKNVFFAIFIFSLGYAGGPQFFSSLNAKGLRLGAFSVIEMTVVLGLALTAMHIFDFDAGTTAGMVAGSATESAVIGTASEAISRLPLPQGEINTLQAKVATAYSLTYIFGLITIVLFTSQIAPLLLRVSLREEADKLWEKLGGGDLGASPDDSAGIPEMTGRVYSVTVAAKKTIRQINDLLGGGARVERVRRKGKSLHVSDELRLKHGDLIMVLGHRRNVIQAAGLIGDEKPAYPSLNMLVETEDYLVTGRGADGLTLAQLTAKITALELSTNMHFVSVLRNGSAMPLLPDLTLESGDQLRLYGTRHSIDRIGRLVGRRLRVSIRTNFVYVGLGIVLGILIGRVTIPLGGIDLSLGTGGGALLTGLVFGWFQNKNSFIPGTSPAALDFMKDMGLAAFVACIGLTSGHQAFALVAEYGFVLPLMGITIATTPAVLSLLVGHFIFKMEIPILLGGIAGQQCSTPALSAVQAAAGNTTPLIGYTITYAISNVLLPLLGPIIVGLAYSGTN